MQEYSQYVEMQYSESASTPFTLPVTDRVSVRLYRDCNPCVLEVAPLQKGLVIIFDGKELIEEGVGFGVPAVKYRNKTYFSSSAQCSVKYMEDCCKLTKRFVLDTVSRKRVGKSSYVNDRFYRFMHRFFEKAYLGRKNMFPLFDKIMELRRLLKIQTEFMRVAPKGTIGVEYSIKPNQINVQVDLSQLEKKECQELLILNEQGSNFFRKYFDSEGKTLYDSKIGPWEIVGGHRASLSNLNGSLKFCLRKQRQGVLFRGWEKTRGRFAWTGLSYSLSPLLSSFDYTIELE